MVDIRPVLCRPEGTGGQPLSDPKGALQVRALSRSLPDPCRMLYSAPCGAPRYEPDSRQSGCTPGHALLQPFRLAGHPHGPTAPVRVRRGCGPSTPYCAKRARQRSNSARDQRRYSNGLLGCGRSKWMARRTRRVWLESSVLVYMFGMYWAMAVVGKLVAR
jgi:hypothetical protein